MTHEVALTAESVLRAVLAATDGWEFDDFVLGFARGDAGPGLDLGRRLKAEVGARLLDEWPHRRVEFERPTARIDVSLDLSVLLRVQPLFIAGRYRKLSRAIPASRWSHLSCKGRGCEACRYTGVLCGPSVQEILTPSLLERTGGTEVLFHGMGREDTDARMLGDGRPFVVEVTDPRRRTFDLDAWLDAVAEVAYGRCEILDVAVVDRTAVSLIKDAGAEKTYRAWIEVDGELPRDAAERAASLAGATLAQLSPKRVMHRRGQDTVREKHVLSSRWLGEIDGLWVWNVRAESGTYIKELVSGDGERTRPSLSAVLGVPARCVALDVLAIHWTGPWEEASRVSA